MNLFVTDPCPCASAVALADKHVVKMPVESAQILSAAIKLHTPGITYDCLCKPTHIHHPVVKWAAASRANAAWIVRHGVALCDEYQHRYKREHASLRVIKAAEELLSHLPDAPATAFMQCVDEDLRGPDVYEAYRGCLRRKYAAWGDKARWTNREKPAWL